MTQMEVIVCCFSKTSLRTTHVQEVEFMDMYVKVKLYSKIDEAFFMGCLTSVWYSAVYPVEMTWNIVLFKFIYNLPKHSRRLSDNKHHSIQSPQITSIWVQFLRNVKLCIFSWWICIINLFKASIDQSPWFENLVS